ncbi:DUF6197 family protein [Streptomyces cadmiisoli]|uniref:Uncharacterized protein n=1 Tax=Streptomyces cadmiisoli TaxID=2184053 RepID=A0A2Z4J7Z6_9ACTN|nr:hypothetical protein [Streptomyces cadmiisoli]AWW40798.1 hypothetical protein DN051_32405 [Streptomyces cadmiisoli]
MGVNLLPDVYERAADLIKSRGHAKGDYVDENGCVCALGALGVALGVEFIRETGTEVTIPKTLTSEYTYYGEYLQDYFACEFEGRNGWEIVPDFNDADDTKPEDVENLLRSCAQDLREEYESWHKA